MGSRQKRELYTRVCVWGSVSWQSVLYLLCYPTERTMILLHLKADHVLKAWSQSNVNEYIQTTLDQYSVDSHSSVHDLKNKSVQKYASLKGFSKRSKMVFFLSVISFFVPEIFKFSYYANLVTDDASQFHLHWVSSLTFLTVYFALCSYKW